MSTIQSPALAQIVEGMLTVSDDTAAELLLKEIGYHRRGQGTTAAGLALERADLAARGLAVGQLTAFDGSGLDRADRATCDLIEADLNSVGSSGPIAAASPSRAGPEPLPTAS